MEKNVQILFDDMKEFIKLCECLGVTWEVENLEGNEFEFKLYADIANLFTLFYRCGLFSISIYQS